MTIKCNSCNNIKSKILIICLVLLSSNFALSHENDDPLITHLMIDKLEQQTTDGEKLAVIDAQAWIGKDLNKLWLKTDIEGRGDVEDAEVQALYSRAIAPFWDIQVGIRSDIKPIPTHTWAVIGFQGLSPYFFDVDAAFFIDDDGRTAARFSAEHDVLFTQRLILSPSIEVNFYGQNDPKMNAGSGLSNVNAGFRLRYEIRRELSPYIGIDWNKKFRSSADFARNNDDTVSETQWVIGIRAWL